MYDQLTADDICARMMNARNSCDVASLDSCLQLATNVQDHVKILPVEACDTT